MVEVLPSTGTGSDTGPPNHEHNKDKNHKENSMMLLRFSTDAGATYYNYEDPRKTVPFDRNSPRRKLDSHEANACNPATGDFINGDKCESVPLRTLSFRNMFQIRERGTILLDKNRSTVTTKTRLP